MSTTYEDATGLVWRKSSRSGNDSNCVEIAVWRKSSRSGNAGNCVEIGSGAGVVGVRDSKNPHGPKLALTPAAWNAFRTGIKAGPLTTRDHR